ncbi:hypothetical protein BRYFOR_08823 [Marvinbryantia formatexigens DSM 14469]|uniref:Uncharacterized protein n=1 Tax=Marvinbryantia formatexigens DSM 14469 TaxID=478749 RepID=C6LJI5_9FIRM|nr:hypothetical protein [Marvinbryantia formatexigens]EET59300.1 hypothetical protein BRYFOR_08823 [Marvinbryantia formatexigens DSM 14469]UWO25376.1 hypothetical protein NQ534_02460 [Marvinbryantia formatexigens DSM 14469]SDG72887.1 hypothetical protein SAMN05660368_03141 [Marvinbryantia formatexigens]
MRTQLTDSSYFPESMTVVPVIVSFDKCGNMLPLYIGIHGESFKILSSYQSSSPRFQKYKQFQCRVEDHGIIRQVELTYHPGECFWTIPKLRWYRD